MSNLYIHHCGFHYHDGPFWDILRTVAAKDPKQTLILTGPQVSKSWVYQQLAFDSEVCVTPHVFTLEELGYAAEGHYPYVNEGLDNYLLRSVLRGSEYDFEGVVSYLGKLDKTLFEYRVTPEAYLQAHPPHLKDRARFFMEALSRFHELQDSLGLTTRRKLWDTVPDISSLVSYKYIYCIGVTEIVPFLQPLFHHVLTRANSVSFQLLFDSSHSFSDYVRPLYEWLLACPDVEVHDVVSPSGDLPHACDVFELEDATLEGEWISKTIRSKPGLTYGVCGHGLRDAFQDYGIEEAAQRYSFKTYPLYFALSKLLRSDTPIVAPSASAWVHEFKDILHDDTQFEFPTSSRQGLIQLYSLLESLEGFARYVDYLNPTGFSSTQFSDDVLQFMTEWTFDSPELLDAPIRNMTMELGVFSDVDVLMLPRAVEGVFPSSFSENPLLASHVRQQLRIPGPTQHMQKEWFYVSLAMLSSRNIVFSYPKRIGQTPTIPTHFFKKLEQDYGIEVTTHTPQLPNVLSEKESQLSLGQDLSIAPYVVSFDSESSSFKSFISEHTFSASQWDTYQRCPHLYFYRYVLALEPPEHTDPDVEAPVWGQLVHSIFQAYYEELPQGQPVHHRPQLLETIARRLFDEAKQPTLFWETKEVLLFGKDGLLKQFLEVDNAAAYSSIPIAFESKVSDGIVDAIFQIPDSSQLYVLDYKTGKSIPGPSDVESFRTLQLPLYMRAVQEMYPEYQVVGGVVFQLHSEHQVEKRVVTCTADTKQEVFECGRKRPFLFDEAYFGRLGIHMDMLKKQILKGAFSYDSGPELAHMASKRTGACRSCDYRAACRFSERFEQG